MNPHFIRAYLKLNTNTSMSFSSLGELFQVLKMMVGSNLKDSQLQQIVDKVREIVDDGLNIVY